MDTYLKIVEENKLKITHIIETHIHADFLCCSRELAADQPEAPRYYAKMKKLNKEDHKLLTKVPKAKNQVYNSKNRKKTI
ncbi:MAG: hypothetical protein ACOYEG_05350 [Petrimonas sp.]